MDNRSFRQILRAALLAAFPMMPLHYQANIDAHKSDLDILLAAPSISYANWSPEHHRLILRQSAGIYHFFYDIGDQVESIYVGKGALGRSSEWNMYERISQHFRPSQTGALLGRASKLTSKTPEECKDEFRKNGLRLQWAVRYNASTPDPKVDLHRNLLWLESFAIAVLKPKYGGG